MKTVTPSRHYIHEAFEAQVERSPDRIAVVFEGKNVTFKQLNTRANQLAHRLRKSGVGPDVIVGACFERSLEMMVGLLAILKAGGAYVPIDPSYPSERISFIIDDTNLAIIVAQRNLVEKLPPKKTRLLLCVDQSPELDADSENPCCEVAPQNLAYVIYTSGSTGTPKGVMISHAAVCNYLSWMGETFDLNETDRFLQKAPFTFDASVWEFYLPLSLGAQLVFAKPGGERDNTYLTNLIGREGITVIQFVPSLLRLFLERSSVEICGSLKHVFSGGEALTIDIQNNFSTRLPSASLYNLYGPTETTIYSTYWLCHTISGQNIVPIGKPIKNTEIYVLDHNLQLARRGEVGEIHIGGAGVAKGYLNRPELTMQRFIPNPFNKECGDRLYKTGDLARYLPDGNLEFLGREDQQVKIRGIRIELKEIESLLGRHPEIKDNVLVVNEVAPGEKRLIAYVVLRPRSVLTTSDLRAYLIKRLPDYMMPSTWILMEALPLSANGKIDRQALPAPSNQRPSLRQAFVEPRSEIETQLRQMWEELLNIEPIGVRDSFFELGGDSLLATQLLIKVEDVFARAIPPSSLIEEPTIEYLAKNISSPIDEKTFSSLVRIQPQGPKRPLFFIHPLGGEVLGYRAMARHLGLDQPFYGLRARGLDGLTKPLTDIESMAAEYIEEIMMVQSQGPFLLGGYSSGGIIAFEMAQQLRRLGHEVEFLAILDEEAPRDEDHDGWDAGLPIRLIRDLPYWFIDHVMRRTGKEVIADVRRLSRKIGKRIMRSALKSRTHQVFQDNVFDDIDLANVSEHTLRVVEASYEALLKYRPQKYDGRISLFRTRAEALFRSHTRDKGWQKLTSNVVEVRLVPGNHPNLLEEQYAPSLAKEISKSLQGCGNEKSLPVPRKMDLGATAKHQV